MAAKGKAQFPKERQLNTCRYFSRIVFKIQSYFMYVFLSILKYLAMCSGKAITSVLLKKKKKITKKETKRDRPKPESCFSSVIGSLYPRESGMIRRAYKESEKQFI